MTKFISAVGLKFLKMFVSNTVISAITEILDGHS